MDYLIFRNCKEKKHIIYEKETDDDAYLNQKKRSRIINKIDDVVEIINYQKEGIFSVEFSNFNGDEITYIISQLIEKNDVQDTIFNNVYLINKPIVKKRIIKYDKVDERTRRSNL